MRKRAIFMICVASLVWFACESGDDKGSSATHDPGSPVTIEYFMPDSGRIREKVIIKGENFGNDLSKVSVYFIDELTERAATVIGVDNNTIYCLAPRQLGGQNAIKIIVEDKEALASERFGYTVAENVSTIAGNASNTGLVDGTLAEARFSYIHGIGAIGNEAVLIFQRDNASVRLVSVPDNAVVTVHNGFQAASPAVTADKTKVYAAGWNSPHVVYVYAKNTGWAPMRVGQLGTQFSGRVRGLALDATEEWLYFCDAQGNFARFEIATQKVEVLNNSTGAATSDGNYVIYNPFDGYFYVSCANKFGIYKISPDGQEVISYAGFNGSAVVNGYVDECAFVQPNGLAIDEDGNIFVCDGFNGYVIRKISIINNYVSIVAGAINVAGQIDGNPVDARFNYPYDIANDGEGNYWIAEGWGCAVRKYAVE
ncbi:MAG: IPT/TIG domain-containing protein [Odoribacteraceae bacterium]|nr:IPT/TIG domain-containing protein [Odoribacteraceae bacterium]